MKHLLFVTLSLTKGGAERVISNMCNDFFIEKGKVTIISLMKAEPEYALDERIRFITLDEREQDYRKSMPVRFLTRRGRCKRLLRSLYQEVGVPDCVISFLPEPNMILCSLKKCLRAPLIISVRNDPRVEYASKVKYAMMCLLYPRSDGYVFQTEQAKDYFGFSQHIIKQSVIIPNPLAKEFVEASKDAETAESRETENHCEARTSEVKDHEKTYRVLAVGRLEKQKNYPLMLEAFADFHEKYPNSSLTIYGEGAERKELEAWICERGLEKCICLPGISDHIRECMEQADLFLMSSVYEGMPNALMEAMAMGLPVISTDCPCGGPAYLIENGRNGFLVPLGDGAKECFAEMMGRLYEDAELAETIAEAAREITVTQAPDVIYAKWESYIEKMQTHEKE